MAVLTRSRHKREDNVVGKGVTKIPTTSPLLVVHGGKIKEAAELNNSDK